MSLVAGAVLLSTVFMPWGSWANTSVEVTPWGHQSDAEAAQWTDALWDDADGIGRLRAVGPLLIVASVAAGVEALVAGLGLLKRGWQGIALGVAGAVALTATLFFMTGADALQQGQLDVDWGAAFSMAWAATALALGGGLGLVIANIVRNMPRDEARPSRATRAPRQANAADDAAFAARDGNLRRRRCPVCGTWMMGPPRSRPECGKCGLLDTAPLPA
jgi:ribosomal protein S27AE